MSITSLSLVIVSIMLLFSQASSARRLRVVDLHNKDPPLEEKRVLLNLSHKNNDLTKLVNAKTNVTSAREQQESNNTPKESDQETHVQVDGNKNEQVGPLKPNKNIETKHRGKMVKTRVNSSRASNPKTVSWHLPRRQRRMRKTKKREMSHDPEFTLDYAPPRVHPPCHN